MSVMLTRENAKPGTSLAQLGGLPPKKGVAAAPAPADQQVSPTTPASPAIQNKISLIIRPSARDRWQSSLLAQYTPQYVENIIRGAMAGNLMSQYLMFDLMERTWPRLSKNLNEVKDAANDLEWNLKPFALKGQKPSQEAQRRARIIEYIIWNMQPDVKKNENDFPDTVYDVLDALGKSISVLEMDIAPEPVQVDFGDGSETVIPLKATRWVHPRYYGYRSDDTTTDELMLNAKEVRFSNPAAELPAGDGSQWVPFPDDKFIVSIIKQKSGHPINSGILSILGFFWAAQNFTWEWFLNYSQIFGQPLRWATYDQNAPQETITLVEQLLRDMGSAAYAAFPAGTQLNLLEAMKGAGENPQKVLIDAADTICDLVILNEAMSSEHGGPGNRGGGTQASATVGMTKRDKRVHAIAGRGAKILNLQLIRPLCRINFGDDSLCPYLEISAKESKDAVAVANKWKTLLSIDGVTVSREQFNSDNDIVTPEDGDDVLVGKSGGAAMPGDGSGGGSDDEDPVTASAHGDKTAALYRGAATNQLVDAALEDATGIAPRWLGAVRPLFEELIAKAKADSVSDEDFIKAVESARAKLPEVFEHMDHNALARVIEQTMAAGVVNGAVRGALQRRKAARV